MQYEPSKYYCKPCKEGHYCNITNEIQCTNHTDYSLGGYISAWTACPTTHECDIYGYHHCTEGFYLDNSGGYNKCTECPVGKFQVIYF